MDPPTTDDDGAVCCSSLLAAPLRVEAADELAAAFSALADPVRLRLLSLVAEAGEVCSCDLQEPLGKSQPTVSHHTKILSEAGLITGEKRGRWVWWSIVPDRLGQLRAVLGS
ncbi:MAG TPA: metalloregulator ArsR/SmtB family transcription factor [Iamia sp.]|nr:metalloregulator ArsR/SmtB family transcription factor [Iamia sp.]